MLFWVKKHGKFTTNKGDLVITCSKHLYGFIDRGCLIYSYRI